MLKILNTSLKHYFKAHAHNIVMLFKCVMIYCQSCLVSCFRHKNRQKENVKF